MPNPIAINAFNLVSEFRNCQIFQVNIIGEITNKIINISEPIIHLTPSTAASVASRAQFIGRTGATCYAMQAVCFNFYV